MTLGSHRYVVGYWESLWPSEPYVRHRFLVDIDLKAVIAGQDRAHRRWTATSVKDLEYMQQILDETHQDFFADPDAYGFDRVDAFPSWAAEAWPWPRVDHGPKRVDLWREPYAISIGPGSAKKRRWRRSHVGHLDVGSAQLPDADVAMTQISSSAKPISRRSSPLRHDRS